MSYRLEKIVSTRKPIYQQLSRYYEFCSRIQQMTDDTMIDKTYVLNNFVQVSRLNDLRKITNNHILIWIRSQKERNNGGRSINTRLSHLKAMLRWQKEMGLKMPGLQLPLIPKVKELPPRKVYFTRQQVQKVLSVATPLEWLLISLAFDCGLRIGELRNIQLTDLRNNSIRIIGKGRKLRYAYLSRQTLAKLNVWIKKNQIKDYLWPSPILNNKPIASCTMRKYMRAAFARTGMTNFCPHDLRHSYATDLKRIGIPTRQIQAGLGHSSENITERYLSDLDGFNLLKMYEKKYA